MQEIPGSAQSLVPEHLNIHPVPTWGDKRRWEELPRPVPITPRRARGIRDKERWARLKGVLARCVRGDRALGAAHTGELGRVRILSGDLLAEIPPDVVAELSEPHVALLVTLARVLFFFRAPGLIASVAQLAELTRVTTGIDRPRSGRQFQRVTSKLVDLEVLPPPMPGHVECGVAASRRENGYVLSAELERVLRSLRGAQAPLQGPVPLPGTGATDRARPTTKNVVAPCLVDLSTSTASGDLANRGADPSALGCGDRDLRSATTRGELSTAAPPLHCAPSEAPDEGGASTAVRDELNARAAAQFDSELLAREALREAFEHAVEHCARCGCDVAAGESARLGIVICASCDVAEVTAKLTQIASLASAAAARASDDADVAKFRDLAQRAAQAASSTKKGGAS